jgi:hypothetical protein
VDLDNGSLEIIVEDSGEIFSGQLIYRGVSLCGCE